MVNRILRQRNPTKKSRQRAQTRQRERTNIFAGLVAQSCMAAAVASLELELRVARKLVYKNKNQQRSTKHYAHFCEVSEDVFHPSGLVC